MACAQPKRCPKDSHTIEAILDKIQEAHPELAKGIESFTEQFEYGTLGKLLGAQDQDKR